jgi:hypothetical protein
VQGMALNAPALGRQATIIDYFLLGLLWLFSKLVPLARWVPGTPWEDLSDEDSLIERVMADEIFENGGIRIQTALSLGQVHPGRALLLLRDAARLLF